jgi:glyoxylase-like metal-dependent hydrolase (beta-lactamase superfamily II)
MRASRLTLGHVEIIGFSAGALMVEGKAVFRAVPRGIWSAILPPDEEGRIPLSLNVFLVKTPDCLILADSGIGTWLDPRYLKTYRGRGIVDVSGALSAFGFGPADIDIVFNSHLHFDHCGGNVIRDGGGSLVPAFPRARYVVQRGEWAAALNPPARVKPSYVRAGLTPLEDSGCLDLVEGDHEMAAGAETVLVPGHTDFHQCLKITSGGRTFFYPGDLVPTSVHVGLEAVMSFDLDPETTVKNRTSICGRAAAGDWVLGFGHDGSGFFGKIGKKGGRFEFSPLG